MPDHSNVTGIEKFGLGQKLDTRAVPDNPWLAYLEQDALQVLGAVSRAEPISFAFTHSVELQAGANTQHRQIVVSGSLALLMCRLCAAIVDAGLFIKFGDPKVEWTPEQSPPKGVVEVLEDQIFHWSDGFSPWRTDPERHQLFAFLLMQMHRFVLLHEAGHILHRHGVRDAAGEIQSMLDGDSTIKNDEAAAIASMARELVADAEAFHLHLGLLDHEFGTGRSGGMVGLLSSKLVGTPRERLRMTFLAAFLVFQVLDGSGWKYKPMHLRTHPPAPFRMKAIYAAAVSSNFQGISPQEVLEEISLSQYMGSVVVDIGLNRWPQLNWLKQVEGLEFDALFERIYHEMPKWADLKRFSDAS
jgi:hypothetical protein